MCVGRGELLASCERSLAGVVIPIDTGRLADAAAGVGSRWLAGSGLVALGLLALGLRGAKRRRDMRRAPRLVDHEVVTLSGVVVAGDHALTAPLSGRSCVVHRSSARLRGPVAKGSSAVHSEQASTSFVVTTASGPVCIEPGQVVLDLVPLVVLDRGAAAKTAFLDRQGIDPARRAEVSFDEIVITPGSKISIRGMIRIELDQARSSAAIARPCRAPCGWSRRPPSRSPSCGAGEEALEVAARYFR